MRLVGPVKVIVFVVALSAFHVQDLVPSAEPPTVSVAVPAPPTPTPHLELPPPAPERIRVGEPPETGLVEQVQSQERTQEVTPRTRRFRRRSRNRYPGPIPTPADWRGARRSGANRAAGGPLASQRGAP